ncbi:SMP-30/gluconolactonase/LRE family protein [Marinimicrobium alkaliphilum]|uniref:SMP-30/gluconolactonase/LRE family protein n=1 Tax=Marinimicrobium alkaliphilum TaxID=2202654 RepID=UPI001300307F|nr:SMP-30/gluconolactonase/LRE family protein [Marinimicrobium alkaliphilum]
MKTPELIAVVPVANALGEGVLWHPHQQAIWWTDIEGQTLYRYHPESQALSHWSTPDRLTAFGFVEASDWLIASFDRGFAHYRPETGECRWLPASPGVGPGMRFNDGRVDPRGRFLSATMVETPALAATEGTLYGVQQDQVQPLFGGLQIPNALCWSPDGETLYHADGRRRTIYRYDYDLATGVPSGRQVFACTPEPIEPDGAVTDRHGNLWNAEWEGASVGCYSPAGNRLLTLPLPVSQPTCVAFGGPDLRWLLVTSARVGLDETDLEAQPEAGHLFIFASDTQGLPCDFYRP